MSRWLRIFEWMGPGPIRAVLFSVPTEGRTLRVVIAGRDPPYRCIVDMLSTVGADDWPPRLRLGPSQIREVRDPLARALLGDRRLTVPEPRGLFAPLGRWVDDRALGRERIILGRVEMGDGSLSVLLVGEGRSPGLRPPRTTPGSRPRGRIVVRMRWGADIIHGTLTEPAAEAMIHALDQALTYPLAGR